MWHFSRDDDHVVWSIEVPKPGKYEVWLQWAQIDKYADNPFVIEAQGSAARVTGTLPSTGGWERYEKKRVGTLDFVAGLQKIVLRAGGPIKEELSDIREIRLVPQR